DIMLEPPSTKDFDCGVPIRFRILSSMSGDCSSSSLDSRYAPSGLRVRPTKLARTPGTEAPIAFCVAPRSSPSVDAILLTMSGVRYSMIWETRLMAMFVTSVIVVSLVRTQHGEQVGHQSVPPRGCQAIGERSKAKRNASLETSLRV